MGIPAKVTIECNGARIVLDVPDLELSMPLDAVDVTPPGANSVHRELGDVIHLQLSGDVPIDHSSGWQTVAAAAPVELPEVRILRLQPGDTLLLTAEHQVTEAELDAIGKNLAERFPGHPVVLLDNGLSLDILRKDGD